MVKELVYLILFYISRMQIFCEQEQILRNWLQFDNIPLYRNVGFGIGKCTYTFGNDNIVKTKLYAITPNIHTLLL